MSEQATIVPPDPTDRIERRVPPNAAINGQSPPVAVPAPIHGMSKELFRALPVAIYTTDANGLVTAYNEAAVRLWGRRPELGKEEYCGSYRLFWRSISARWP